MWLLPAFSRLYSAAVVSAFSLRAHARRETPTIVSHGMAIRRMVSTRSEPSSTMPKPPLTARPMPVPPPLCSAIRLMPRAAFPAKHCAAMSAMMFEPSLMLEVSRNGESVPPVSWWSRPSMTGPISPRRTISLNFRARFIRPIAS